MENITLVNQRTSQECVKDYIICCNCLSQGISLPTYTLYCNDDDNKLFTVFDTILSNKRTQSRCLVG